ncbi:hypothetical protein [uncultured Sneathiella sp.]|jgi:Flp pilus assembly pilin Flp|uniref:TadE/TadG family type IV pilus assembly protein n=1 Tax=uncultured Sneathiella sp. TaxID=879315 RepID=UPI0030DAF8CD|tara:strand:- start:11186 stop:11743 length:558 start_codon:yes stop_codon:yes gene_type:complete
MVANALKNNPKDVIRDQRGSLAVEVALIVPAIMFLLLAGVTLAHIVQLTRTTDRVAALMADDLSLKSGLIEEDFDTVLAATTGLIGESGFPAAIRVDLSALELSDDGSATVLWNRSRTNGGLACAPAAPALPAPGDEATLQFILVDLCVTPADGFFLSGFLSVAGFTLHGRALAVGRKAAVRSLG